VKSFFEVGWRRNDTELRIKAAMAAWVACRVIFQEKRCGE
jgi:hypothetical protein